MSKKNFYITTAIDYPNGAPHMGHAYEKIVADAYARWYRMAGYRTWFVTGTDENGQKLKKAAEEKGLAPKEFVDEHVKRFKKLCQDLEITNDDFIRTSEPRHIQTAQEFWKILQAKDDIYSGEYEGLYCLACEAFYTDLQAPDLRCPVHGTGLEAVKEKGFFFRLSKYADWIQSYIKENKSFILPISARKEILQRIKSDKIRDLSVSRPNSGWGIPLPGQDDYVMYTWFDALINYFSAVKNVKELSDLWPAQVHIIGKDITWFHTIIWPCMLKAAGFAIPQQVYVHGMVLGQDGKKMSKSLGNGVDPNEIISQFPVDSFRYYMLRATPSGLDGAFVTEDLITRHNSELANDYGNLLMRVVKLGMKKLGNEFSPDETKARFDFVSLGEKMHECMERREHHRALEFLWTSINEVNLYLNNEAPWKKDIEPAAFKNIIYNALHALHCFVSLVEAFMPQVGQKTLIPLGTKNIGMAGLKFGQHRFQLQTPEPLFPKIEKTERE